MRDDWCSSVASKPAARRISRLSWARAGSEYMSETTSPCSVSFIVASTVPNGADSTAAAAGPPPRPTVPPRPLDLPLRRRDPGALVGVRVAEHDLLQVAAVAHLLPVPGHGQQLVQQ